MPSELKVQSAARALMILRILEKGPLKLSEISARIEIHSPGALKLLRTLIDEDLVSKSDDGSYSLGLGCCRLARAYLENKPFAQAARPILAELCASTGQPAVLAVLDGLDQVNLMKINPAGGHPSEAVPVRVGPAWPQATGLVLLSGQTPGFVDRHLERHPLKNAPRGARTRSELNAILEKARGEGRVTVNVDESLKFLAMPACDIHGATAAAVGIHLDPNVATELQARKLEKAARLVSLELAGK